MKNSRLFEILYLLVEKRSLTAGELARRFEVSERTIYRDVDALSAAGIPVYAQQGRGGGIRLMDQFVLDRALLSTRQQDELLFALQAVLATGAAEAGDTLSRLSSLFRREGGDWLEVDFADWGSGVRERENFRLVKESVLSHRLLSFTYYGSDGRRTRRRVEPARLVFKSGVWYLQAFCLKRRDWRFFRLARMDGPALEEEQFQPRPAPAGIEAPVTQAAPVARLRLRFAPSCAYRVRDYFHPDWVTQERDGHLLVACDFPEDNWLLGFLLSFGDQAQVLSPPRWRALVRDAAKKTAVLYETGQASSSFVDYPYAIQEGDTSPTHKEEFSMEDRKFCQCCAMPLDDPRDQGTEADGSLSGDYCRYCYQNGAFTAPDATMDDIIAFNLKFNEENGHPFGPQEEAEKMMRGWFPALKRWKK